MKLMMLPNLKMEIPFLGLDMGWYLLFKSFTVLLKEVTGIPFLSSVIMGVTAIVCRCR